MGTTEKTIMAADGVDQLSGLPQTALERAAFKWIRDRGPFEQVSWGEIRRLALAELAPVVALPDPGGGLFQKNVLSLDDRRKVVEEMKAKHGPGYNFDQWVPRGGE